MRSGDHSRRHHGFNVAPGGGAAPLPKLSVLGRTGELAELRYQVVQQGLSQTRLVPLFTGR